MSVLLSAALIVRDEARVLEDCLASIRPVVDEIIVVDTGSVDDSPAIAARYGARVIHHPWQNDFAEARNVSLDAAQGEWSSTSTPTSVSAAATGQASSGCSRVLPEVAFRLLLRPDQVSTPYREYRMWRHDRRIRFTGHIPRGDGRDRRRVRRRPAPDRRLRAHARAPGLRGRPGPQAPAQPAAAARRDSARSHQPVQTPPPRPRPRRPGRTGRRPRGLDRGRGRGAAKAV